MQRIIVFDLDGTLLSGDSFIRFLVGLMKIRPARLYRVLLLPFAIFVFACNLRDNSWLKSVFLHAILGGLRQSELESYINNFVHTLIGKQLRPIALRRLKDHQKNGDYLILASASPDIYVAPFGKELGFDEMICTRLRKRKNRYTGEFIDENCYGRVKLERLDQSLGHTNIDVAYSDHDADLPLLLAAKTAVAVSPNAKLARFASKHGIVVENWEAT